jgi:putative membrane protein
MSKQKQHDATEVPGRSLAKGLIAGAIAGLVATAAKSLAEKVYPPRKQGEPDPPELLADRLAGHALAPATRSVAVGTSRWGLGAAAGAGYGAVAEFFPTVTERHGANFGMTLMTLSHEGVLPALGLAPRIGLQSNRERTSEMATYIVFGLVAETARRIARRLL